MHLGWQVPLCLVGAALVWAGELLQHSNRTEFLMVSKLGWFSFNGGSALRANFQAVSALVCTQVLHNYLCRATAQSLAIPAQ